MSRTALDLKRELEECVAQHSRNLVQHIEKLVDEFCVERSTDPLGTSIGTTQSPAVKITCADPSEEGPNNRIACETSTEQASVPAVDSHTECIGGKQAINATST